MKVVLLAVRNSLLIDQCDAMHWTGHSRDDYSSRSLWTRSNLAVEPVDQRVDVGAKLGAIPCGLRRTGVDGCGLGSRSFKTLRTVLGVGGSPWRSTDQEVGSVEEGSGTGLALLVRGGLYEFVILPIWLIEKGFRPPVVTAA